MDAFGGEAIGLFCGFIWALNGIITRTQSHKVSPMLMNAIRCGSAGLCFWIALALTSSTAVYGLLSGREWGLLIGSVLIGVTIGDTLYLWSIREIGISRTMALVGVVPLTTLVSNTSCWVGHFPPDSFWVAFWSWEGWSVCRLNPSSRSRRMQSVDCGWAPCYRCQLLYFGD